MWTPIAAALLMTGLAVGAPTDRQDAAVAARPGLRLEGVLDPAGKPRSPFGNPAHHAVVLLFISIDCPICNRYAPEIQRMEARFGPEGVKFWLIQPDADQSLTRTRKHLQEFGYNIDLLRDTQGNLVRLTQARVTPEAAVFNAQGRLVYRGRIDDRYADFGKARPEPTRRELQDALESLLAGRPIAVTNAPAVGCAIPPLTR